MSHRITTTTWIPAFAGLAVLGLLTAVAYADDGTPASPETIKDYSGKWQVTDAEASKTCDVMLGTEDTIGGKVIEIAPDCTKTFPVMDEISAWRMHENGDIVFADATRKLRLRFYTADETYISVEEVDGIARLSPVQIEISPAE